MPEHFDLLTARCEKQLKQIESGATDLHIVHQRHTYVVVLDTKELKKGICDHYEAASSPAGVR